MNIIYSSDNNYARHVGISITSLFASNHNVPDINVYLICDDVSKENIARLNSIATQYGRSINYIPFEPYKQRLILNNKWELPISAYARLFIAEMLPESIDRILYLDCDTVVCDNLLSLWNMDMKGKTIGAVEDVASCIFQNETGISHPYRYFCSGVLLIDLNKWRRIHALDLMLKYLDSRCGEVRHHDQTILNGVFGNDCIMLHPKYDALTPTFIMSYKNLKAYFRLWDEYYTKQEIQESVKHPAIIHYTSSNIGRPWENSKHPKAKIYQKYWRSSPWKSSPRGMFKSSYDAVQRKTFWLYQHVPVEIIHFISSIRRNGK